MSADLDIATRGEIVGDGTTLAGRTRNRWLNARGFVALGAIILILAVVIAVLTARTAPQNRLDADSAQPDGARAVLAVLGGHGVTVHRTTSLDEAVDLASRPGTTLALFDRDGVLAGASMKRLESAAANSDLVLVDPDFNALATFAPEVAAASSDPVVDPSAARSFTDRVPDPVQAHCDNPGATAAGEITAGGTQFQAALEGADVDVCFPDQDAAAGLSAGGAAEDPTGSFASYSDGGRRITALGNWSVLSNGAIGDHGNAALALTALGSQSSLVYYVPTIADQPTAGTTPPSLIELLPRWVLPVGAWAVLVSLVAFIWRGRRFGPLVVEPMPVIVRAAETVEGRARLYRRSGSRDRAAVTLRAASMTRIAARLKLPRSSRAHEVIDAVAAKTGRPPAQVAAVLLVDRVADDASLQRLARDLHTLEKEVQQP